MKIFCHNETILLLLSAVRLVSVVLDDKRLLLVARELFHRLKHSRAVLQLVYFGRASVDLVVLVDVCLIADLIKELLSLSF